MIGYIYYLICWDDRRAIEAARGREEGSQGAGLLHAQGFGQRRPEKWLEACLSDAHIVEDISALAQKLLYPLHGYLRLHAR